MVAKPGRTPSAGHSASLPLGPSDYVPESNGLRKQISTVYLWLLQCELLIRHTG